VLASFCGDSPADLSELADNSSADGSGFTEATFIGRRSRRSPGAGCSHTHRADTRQIATQDPVEAKLLPLDAEFAEMAEPSPGYEPLLVQMGLDQFAARGLAKFAVRRARKRAEHSKLYRQIFKDIRFLAKGPRQRAALIRCARRLHDSWEATPILGDILFQANVDEFEFMRLLKLAAAGHDVNFNRTTKVAAEIASQLSIKRGPKIRPASVAHEFFLKGNIGIELGPWPKPQQDRAAEYVDALTAATRKEFNFPDFDSRPAQRRLRALKDRLFNKNFCIN
jgi:hypothetical protein